MLDLKLGCLKMLKLAVVLCLLGVVVGGPPVSRSRKEIEDFREFLESTRTEKGVDIPDNPESSAWENSGKFQGDILLDEEQVEDLVARFASDVGGRHAYLRPGSLWPGRTVVFEFAAGHFNTQQVNYIINIMNIIQSRTCIRFRWRNPGERNYALITGYNNGCYASVGFSYTRGVHTMNVARNTPGRGCMNGVIIAHEWFHVIGFLHMQSTYNRDNYVRINWGNIVRGMEFNFYRFDRNLVSNLGLPYEHESSMHYGPFAFSANGRTTIDATRPHVGIMGQLTHITGWDFMRVDRHYGCQAWRTADDYQNAYVSTPEAMKATNEFKEDLYKEFEDKLVLANDVEEKLEEVDVNKA